MTEHVIVVHRWRDSYALYEDYLDHRAFDVSYIVTPLAASSAPRSAAAIEVVSRTDDLAELVTAAGRLCRRFGQPSRIVALNEGDLDAVAELRVLLGCPGETPQSQAVFRDKHTMVAAVAAAGVPTPRFAAVASESEVLRFLAQEGGPIIVKPRFGTASRGVVRIDTAKDVAKLAGLPDEPRLAQSFCPAPVFHIDGVWNGARLVSWRASRYLNTCVDFTVGSPLGSVEVDDPKLLGHLGEFSRAAIAAITSRPAVVHMEAFVAAHADRGPDITFLEIGGRVGGAEIPFLWREVHGIDLAAAATAIQLGRPLPEQPAAASDEVGGWLLIPTPVPAPCRVDRIEHEPAESGPYLTIVPPVGQCIPKAGGYEHVGARMRFRAPTSAEVEKAVRYAAERFQLYCSPVSA